MAEPWPLMAPMAFFFAVHLELLFTFSFAGVLFEITGFSEFLRIRSLKKSFCSKMPGQSSDFTINLKIQSPPYHRQQSSPFQMVPGQSPQISCPYFSHNPHQDAPHFLRCILQPLRCFLLIAFKQSQTTVFIV